MYRHSASHSSPPAATPRVLVALQDAREEVCAGHGGTLLIVRTLDGLSCSVHAGELLRLIGGVASGARSLLRAFDGPHARIQVERRVASGVQLRRGCIPAIAEPAIVAGWCDVCTDAPSSEMVASSEASRRNAGVRATVVYLLRVRGALAQQFDAHEAQMQYAHVSTERHSVVTNVHAWRTWAATVRRQGGAIVLASGKSAESTPAWDGGVRQNEQRATHRGALPDHLRIREPRAVPRSSVRTLTLRAGRIVRAWPDERQE